MDSALTADEVVRATIRKRLEELGATVSPRDKFTPQRSAIAGRKGPQEMARESDADIVIMGGAAYGGKTWSLQTDQLDGIEIPGFEAVQFRRLTTAITMPGGLAPESFKLYPLVGGTPKDRGKRWEFETKPDGKTGLTGATITMHHMQFESDARKWELGAQLARAGFDQLEEFEEMMFWVIVGRMRSSTGIKTKIFATVNPVPAADPIGGWVNSLLSWWWNPKTGYAIPERSGVKRWFYRVIDQLFWYDSKEEAIEKHPDLYRETTAAGEERLNNPKSVCFIAAGIDDNPIGEELNPDYRGSLNTLSEVKRERMKKGNWLIVDSSKFLIDISWFADRFIDPEDVPAISRTVRFWDKASTRRDRKKANPKHSKTASCKQGVHIPSGQDPDGLPLPKQFYIFGATGDFMEMVERERFIMKTAKRDGRGVHQRVEEEPAGAGKDSARGTVGRLANAGFNVAAVGTKGEDKLTRCMPWASDIKAGNVWIVRGWDSKPFLDALAQFDGNQPGSDEADCGGGGYNELNLKGSFGRPMAIG